MAISKKGKPSKGKPPPSDETVMDRTRLAEAEGNNIRNWRLFRKIETQRDLSDITKARDPKGIGLARVSICRLETGELRYNEDHLRILADALSVSVRDLIGTNPYDAGDIFAVYAGLPETAKRRAMKLIQNLKPAPRD